MNQKQRSLALLGAAVVVAAGLGGIIYKTDLDTETKKNSDEKASQLNTFDTTKVDWVKVTAKGSTTEIRKTGTNWEISDPLQAPVDVGTLDALIGRLSELKSKNKVEEKATDLAKYGLDKPKVQVWAKGVGIDVNVLLGDENAFNYTQYAKRAGDQTIYLIEGGSSALEKTTFDLRDKRVLTFEASSATALQVKSPDGDYSLTKSPEGWRLVAPQPERADDTVVGQILATLAGLRAVDIPEEKTANLAKYGLDNPSRIASVTVGSTPLTFFFGSPKDQEHTDLFAVTSAGSVVYKLVGNAIDLLKQTPATLEDKTIAKFDTAQVAAMSFTIPGGATILVQRKRSPADAGPTPEAWTQMSPRPGEGKTLKIGGLMHSFSNLRAAKVMGIPTDLKPYGLDAPKQTVKVQNAVGEAILDLAIGSADGSNIYVKSAHDPRVFEVEKYKVANLPEGPDDLLNAAPDGGAAEEP